MHLSLRRAATATLLSAALLAAVTIATGWITGVRQGVRSGTEITGGGLHHTWNPHRSGSSFIWSGWTVQRAAPSGAWPMDWGFPRKGVHGIGGWSYVGVPLGSPTLALAAAGVSLLALARRARRRRGQCPACGYDLGGLKPDVVRCPECEHDIEHHAPTQPEPPQ